MSVWFHLLKQVCGLLYAFGLAHINEYIAGMVVAAQDVGFGQVQIQVYQREFTLKRNIVENSLRQYLNAAECIWLQAGLID